MTVFSTPPMAIITSRNANVLTVISPALSHTLYFAAILQRLLSTTTVFVLFRAYILSLLLLQQSFYASQTLLIQGYNASTILANQMCFVGKYGWKATESLRKKLFFEFIVFILGSGNGLILLVFWPGWIVLGGSTYLVCRLRA